MTPLETALDYIERGWAPIPIPYRKKNPGFDDWQKLRVTKENAAAHFNDVRQNIGVLLGEASGNLVDADLDWPKAARLAAFLLPTKCIFGRASKPRSHYIYKCPLPSTIKYQIAGDKGGTILELRSNGAQTVFPGSTHEDTGEAIEFALDEGAGETTPEKLKRAAGVLAGACLLLRAWVPGVKDELATAVAGTLLRGGWAPDKVDRFIEIVSTEAGDRDIPGKLKAETLAAGLKDKTKRVPGMPRLKELLGDLVAAKFAEWLGLKMSDELQPFPAEALLTLDEFTATEFPPLVYVIDGLLYAPSIMMLYAPRGQGKTWLAQTMAISLASGQPFLFWPVVEPLRVLYVDGEMPSALLQERFLQLTRAKGLPITIMGNDVLYRVAGETFCINNIAHQQRFIATLQAQEELGRGRDMIIFDNLSALTFGIDENSNSEQDAMVAFFRELRLMGKSVVFLHHSGKSGDQRGASRREDILDLVIKLSAPAVVRGGGCEFRFEVTKSRGKEPTPLKGEARLIVGKGGLLEWAMDSAERRPKPEMPERILRCIASNKPRTQADVARALGVEGSTITYHLKRLRDAKLVQPELLSLTRAGRNHLKSALFEEPDDDAPSF